MKNFHTLNTLHPSLLQSSFDYSLGDIYSLLDLLECVPINTQFLRGKEIRTKLTQSTYRSQQLSKTSLHNLDISLYRLGFTDVDQIAFPSIRHKFQRTQGWKVIYNISKRKTL